MIPAYNGVIHRKLDGTHITDKGTNVIWVAEERINNIKQDNIAYRLDILQEYVKFRHHIKPDIQFYIYPILEQSITPGRMETCIKILNFKSIFKVDYDVLIPGDMLSLSPIVDTYKMLITGLFTDNFNANPYDDTYREPIVYNQFFNLLYETYPFLKHNIWFKMCVQSILHLQNIKNDKEGAFIKICNNLGYNVDVYKLMACLFLKESQYDNF